MSLKNKDPNIVKEPISKTPFIVLVICLTVVAVTFFPMLFFQYFIDFSDFYYIKDEELKLVDESYDYNLISPGDSLYIKLENKNLINAYIAFTVKFKAKDNKSLTKEQKDYLNYLNNSLMFSVENSNVVISKSGSENFIKDENDKIIPLKSKQSIIIKISLPLTLENRINDMPKLYLEQSVRKSFFGALYY